MNGNYKEGRRNHCRSIFLPLSVQNLSILGLTELKPCTFFTPKRLKPLSVNTFRVNQQALFKNRGGSVGKEEVFFNFFSLFLPSIS